MFGRSHALCYNSGVVDIGVIDPSQIDSGVVDIGVVDISVCVCAFSLSAADIFSECQAKSLEYVFVSVNKLYCEHA